MCCLTTQCVLFSYNVFSSERERPLHHLRFHSLRFHSHALQQYVALPFARLAAVGLGLALGALQQRRRQRLSTRALPHAIAAAAPGAGLAARFGGIAAPPSWLFSSDEHRGASAALVCRKRELRSVGRARACGPLLLCSGSGAHDARRCPLRLRPRHAVSWLSRNESSESGWLCLFGGYYKIRVSV